MPDFRSDAEIDEVLNMCNEQEELGGSLFQGMTYEQGIQCALRWVTGDSDDHPMAD
ncbi:MAG: hypothetical protein COA63_010830 [Methylophaga sp.]|nr:hypothetical protein [Methylophaga sp.]